MAKKIKVNLKTVKKLASCGYSNLQIAEAVGISKTYLYNTVAITDTIKEAQAELRQKIAQDLIDRSETDSTSTASIFLSKRLNLFATTYKMPQIKSVKSALTQISRINSDLASGSIPPELANNLIKNIETFIKTFEVSELEKRIERLENADHE